MPVSTKAGVACLCGGVLLYQTVLPALVRCLLAGRNREREWPGAREEGEWGVAAEKQLTTASRATANLGLWLHLGSPQVLCSPPHSSVHS